MRIKDLAVKIFESTHNRASVSSASLISEDTELFEVSFRDEAHEQEILNGPIECGFEVEMVWTKKIPKSKTKPTGDDIVAALEANKLDKLYAKYPDAFTKEIIAKITKFLQDEYKSWADFELATEIKKPFFRKLLQSEDTTDIELINKFIKKVWGVRPFKERVEKYWRETASNSEKRKPIDIQKWAKKYMLGAYWYNEAIIEEFIEDNSDLLTKYQKELEKKSKSLITYKNFMNEFDTDNLLMFLDDLMPDLDPFEMGDDLGNAIASVKNFMKNDWVKQNSMFKEVSDTANTKAWHFHYDGSIDAEDMPNNIPVEISSPVFPTPNIMLTEMASLFNYLIANKAKTNESTGLHVTMSYRGPTQQYNKVKIVLLLNDKYWLEKFNRQNNEYASSQIDRIVPNIDVSKALTLKDSQLKQIEKVILPTIATDKYYAVHFKNLENIDKNKLIEFRIMGGSGYEKQYSEVKKAVTQYAGVMEAGYNPEAFKDEYNEELRKILQIVKQSSEQVNEFQKLIKRLMQSVGDAPNKVKRNLSAFVEPSSNIGTLSFLYPLLDWLAQSISSNKINSSNFTTEDQKLFASVLKQKQLDGITKQYLRYSENRTELKKIEKLLFGSDQ